MSTTEWLTKGACAACKNAGVFLHQKDDLVCKDCFNRRAALDDEVEKDVEMEHKQVPVPLTKATSDEEVDDPAHPDVQRAVLWASYRLFARVLARLYAYAPQRPLRVRDEIRHIWQHMDMPHNGETRYNMVHDDEGYTSMEPVVIPFAYSRPGEAPYREVDRAAALLSDDGDGRNTNDRIHAPYEHEIFMGMAYGALCPQCHNSFEYCRCVAVPSSNDD